jgi:hypothetical protein
MVKLLLWLLLLVICWPVALLALLLWPIVWLLSIPFGLLRALIMLPARVLGGDRR